MLGVAAKLERRRIAERTALGRADAKAKGVKFGRKPKLTPHQQREARARVDAGEPQRSVARSHNVGSIDDFEARNMTERRDERQQQVIRERAYAIWKQEGHPDGKDLVP